jgi:bifunctional DNA-binding transcriptional regulator/antitoxin component of YhaV-PrlF toxin-antitoxin module
MKAKSWTVTLEEDPDTGDLILPFTDEILAELGWKEGDVLDWVDNKDGSWSLVKKKSKKNKKVVAKSKTI